MKEDFTSHDAWAFLELNDEAKLGELPTEASGTSRFSLTF
jgi:hypothetical protein